MNLSHLNYFNINNNFVNNFVNVYEMDIRINGENILIVLLKYDDDKFSFDCSTEDFKKLNTLHLDSFSFKVNVYNKVDDLVRRIYYSDCNYSEFNSEVSSSDVFGFYTINMRVKYFKSTKVPFEHINGYERELKLERILSKDGDNK